MCIVKIQIVNYRCGLATVAINSSDFPSHLFRSTMLLTELYRPVLLGLGKTTMLMRCVKDPNAKTAIVVDDQFLPRRSGDLTIMYDVTGAYDTNYWAQVTLSNRNPLGRLDYRMLSWDWMRDEFIYAMKGAYTYVVDTMGCIYGEQANFYQAPDFSTALNCQRRPTIVDLPPSKANDLTLGLVPFCCRNEAQLAPFDNRTALALAWAELKHRAVPNPLPCGDNCGVSFNWHLYTDYSRGWTARTTLFNWEDTVFPDWFVAVEMDKAAPGFEKAYSFNGTLVANVNNTIFMQGLSGFNYLLGETNGSTASDPRVPGKQQTVISFIKKNTTGIKMADGDGFPTKVYFNGEECSLPDILPTSGQLTAAA
ncbi:hypothetical protein Ancab_013030 [Ancistrocladus abbreviatus]